MLPVLSQPNDGRAFVATCALWIGYMLMATTKYVVARHLENVEWGI